MSEKEESCLFGADCDCASPVIDRHDPGHLSGPLNPPGRAVYGLGGRALKLDRKLEPPEPRSPDASRHVKPMQLTSRSLQNEA